MKPKSTTFVEKMRFKDIDLTSPKHDEIIIWLMKPINLIRVMEEITKDYPLKYDESLICKHEESRYCFAENNKERGRCVFTYYKDGENFKELCPLHQERENSKKLDLNKVHFEAILSKIELEYPIINEYNKFIIGFIDLVATFSTSIKSENLIFMNKVKNLGPEIIDRNTHKSLGVKYIFEVKTKIESFGETLRQINTYKKYLDGVYVLITPKTPFKKAFEDSNVKVYEIN